MLNKIVDADSVDKKEDESTEERILRAAEAEFMAKGFAGARTTAIAEAAGVTHAMFHYYFRTKQKLFDKIVGEKLMMLKSLLWESIDDVNLGLEDMIKSIIDRHLDFISANPDLPRFIIGELYSNQESAKIIMGQFSTYGPLFISALQDKIDAQAATGRYRRVDAKMLMLDIASLNIMPFIVSPIVNAVLDNCMVERERFLADRKRENFDTIMRKLNIYG